jgi:hypothetical protein
VKRHSLRQFQRPDHFTAPLEIDSKFIHLAFASSFTSPKPKLELCAPLAILFLIANYLGDGIVALMGSHTMGGGQNLLKISHTFP